MQDPAQVLDYLRSLRGRHTDYFSGAVDRLLAFVGTTSEPGTRADIFARPIVRLEDAGGGGVTDVVVRGKLPRELGPHERITVMAANLKAFTGFQLKTARLEPDVPLHHLYESDGGLTRIHARFVYTVHASPHLTSHFPSVPVQAIRDAIEGTRYAFVGIGHEANISPRFVWSLEAGDGAIHLCWGDAQVNKTASNFGKNRALSALVVDLQSFDGMLLRGEGSAFTSREHPQPWDAVLRGFASGGWGQPKLAIRASFGTWGRV